MFNLKAGECSIPVKLLKLLTIYFVCLTQQPRNSMSDKKKPATQYLSNDVLRDVWDHMLEGIQIIGFDWRYLYLNNSVAEHGHYKKEELLGYTMMEKYPGIEKTELFGLLIQCMKERTVHHLENEFTYPDSTKGWFDLSIQPVAEGILIMSIDITSRKLAEQAVKELNTNLEWLVNKRTEQLNESNKELESFSYSVSHDLRAPLRAVVGYARILEEEYAGKMDDEGRQMLASITGNVNRMGTLIDDLLAFSRLGRREIQKVNVNMNELVAHCLEDIDAAVKNNARIETAKLLPAKADYAMIVQVMVNLLSNALKYSAKVKKPVIKIDSKAGEKEITYSVHDNGVGFEMKYIHKLFEVFERLHAQDEYEGTGVGLAIVKRIVSKHGGRVWAESEPGKGASFYFTLPTV